MESIRLFLSFHFHTVSISNLPLLWLIIQMYVLIVSDSVPWLVEPGPRSLGNMYAIGVRALKIDINHKRNNHFRAPNIESPPALYSRLNNIGRDGQP